MWKKKIKMNESTTQIQMGKKKEIKEDENEQNKIKNVLKRYNEKWKGCAAPPEHRE